MAKGQKHIPVAIAVAAEAVERDRRHNIYLKSHEN